MWSVTIGRHRSLAAGIHQPVVLYWSEPGVGQGAAWGMGAGRPGPGWGSIGVGAGGAGGGGAAEGGLNHCQHMP